MNTVMTWQTVSTNSAQTEQLGEHIGSKLCGGEVIELISDLGGGKTTFTRGLVRGAGSIDKVSSPTFAISREYAAPKFRIVHFDFYRLNEAGIVADELAEILSDDTYVTVVEWGEIVADVLGGNKITVSLVLQSDGSRKITVAYPEKYGHLLEAVK